MQQKPAFDIWQSKPWWCQPWSILLTGCSLIGGSWALFGRLWLTSLVALPVLTWMVYFLLIYPKLMQSMISESPDRAEP